MRNLLVQIGLWISIVGCVTAQTAEVRQPSGYKETFRIAGYKDGVLKIQMSTCGGRIQPVVTLKPLQETSEPGLMYGLYRATLEKSAELTPNTICPYIADPILEVNLKEHFIDWAQSEKGTAAAKILVEKKGFIEIVVTPFMADIDYQGSLK